VSGQVDTIEIKSNYAGFVRARYPLNTRIRVRRGDGRAWLTRLLKDKRFGVGIHFFYLDAHWEEDLLLAEEIDLIFSSETDAIVMVDDIQVPDDPGYSYDDYGTGKRLNEEYIRGPKARHRLACFCPVAQSSKETGARRGSVVLTRSNLLADISQLRSLRQIEK
jgi:hypothetical protein